MSNPAPNPPRPDPIVVQAMPATALDLPPCPCHQIDLGPADAPIEVMPTPVIEATCR